MKGYLVKTVQESGVLKKQKFLKRYYILNAKAMTLYVADNPSDKSGNKMELRNNRLAHVECNLSNNVE